MDIFITVVFAIALIALICYCVAMVSIKYQIRQQKKILQSEVDNLVKQVANTIFKP